MLALKAEDYQFVVSAVLKRYYRRWDWSSYEDLFQEGMLGLMKAADRFDPKRGVSFKAFAWYTIHRSIMDYLRTQDFLSRRHRREIETANDDPEFYRPLSLDDLREIGSWDRGTEQRLIIDSALKRLTPRCRLVILLLYFEELSQDEVSLVLNVHPSRVSQIHSVAIERLRNEVQRKRVTPSNGMGRLEEKSLSRFWRGSKYRLRSSAHSERTDFRQNLDWRDASQVP